MKYIYAVLVVLIAGIILAIAFGIIVAMNLVAGKNMKNTQSW